MDREKVLRAAPIVLTVAAAIWTAAVTPYSEYGDNWAILPFIGIFVLVLLWHVALLIRGPGRSILALYGVLHIGFWVPFGLYCMMRISKDSL